VKRVLRGPNGGVRLGWARGPEMDRIGNRFHSFAKQRSAPKPRGRDPPKIFETIISTNRSISQEVGQGPQMGAG